ncbi:hypothetical protein PMIN06_000409 [Paraphaeosphaeria minitans]
MVRRSARNAAKPEGFYRESAMTKRAQGVVVPALPPANRTVQKNKKKPTSVTRTGRVQKKKPAPKKPALEKPAPKKPTAKETKADKKKPGRRVVPSNDVRGSKEGEIDPCRTLRAPLRAPHASTSNF